MICSLIVMFRSLLKNRWKIPNLRGHALEPPGLFFCSCKTKKRNRLCLHNFVIFFYVSHKAEKQNLAPSYTEYYVMFGQIAIIIQGHKFNKNIVFTSQRGICT